MKDIKALLVIATLLLSSISCAQPPGGGGQRGGQEGPPPIPNSKQIKEMVSDLAKEISLSDEQEASVLDLYTAHFEEVKAKTSGNSRPKREEMEALKTDFEKSVKALLTADQQKKYEAYLKKNAQRRPSK